VQALGGVDVLKAMRVVLDQAKSTGDAFTQLFTGMGSFGVLAACSCSSTCS
jgi:hypothetical protein